MPPKNFPEGSDKLKLATAFCNVFGRRLAGNGTTACYLCEENPLLLVMEPAGVCV